jgi:signal transduction histidine kinase
VIDRIFPPGLQRRLVVRSVALSVLGLFILAGVAFWASADLITRRFDEQSRFISRDLASDVANQVDLTTRAAATIAGLQGLRTLITDPTTTANEYAAYLLPLKGRLGVDILTVADESGRIIGAAQDFRTGELLPGELLRRAGIRAEEAWVIKDEPQGLTVRAISMIRDQQGQPLGLVQTGYILDVDLLNFVKRGEDTEVVLLLNDDVKASTLGSVNTAGFPAPAEVDLVPSQTVTRTVELGGVSYLATFTVLPTHAGAPALIAILLPLAPITAARVTLVVTLALLVVGLSLATAVIAHRLARTMTRPLRALAAAAERVERGERGFPVATDAADEVGTLQHALASMVGALDERERQLVQTNEELERASRLKSEFLANVSHELRTPLNAIIGYSKMMLEGMDGELSDQQSQDIVRIGAAGENLLVLINGLLDLAKIEAGRFELSLGAVSLSSEVAAVLDLVRPDAEAKGISVTSTVGEDVPLVMADPQRVRQILANLAANAIKFTERGGVIISARQSQDELVVTVADTGIGIAAEAHRYVFDEFRQEDATTTRRYGGTGLGLAIAKKLVELQGGRIWLESARGIGSQFHFTLPLAAGRAARPQKPARSPVHA